MIAKPSLHLRVTVGDTWRQLLLAAEPEESVASLKARALSAASIGAPAAGYEVKVGGAVVRDESRGVAASGMADGGSAVVLSRRRRPVR